MAEQFQPTRRIVFHGLGALAVAAALAGCAGGDDGESTTGGSEGGSGDTATPGDALATTSEVPVEGGLILTGAKLVLTQPTEGEFKAYSAVCPHQGQLVTDVADGTITCSHHGSQYDAASGDVTQGPATSGLEAVEITVEGDQILLA
ncbi:Rieske (2Fe-2S) protein [Nocardioides pacificus]